MGFRFRKSKSFGPFRVNVSKSGIGWSVGTKGARYTKRADGKTQTTFSVPGTGISYVDVSGSKKSTSNNTSTANNVNSNFSSENNNVNSSFSAGSNNDFKKNNNDKNPFYKRLWFMWLMLFIFPPVGIILMWLYSGYKKAPKVILSTIFAIMFIASLGDSSTDTSSVNKNTTSTTEIADSTKDTDESETEKVQASVLTGWQQEGNDYYYYDANGVKKTGWIEDKGNKYYLSDAGVMQTGWVQDNNKYYYLNTSGVMQKGWVEDKNKYYYCSATGEMQIGWITYKNNKYYLNSDGVMQTGWVSISGKDYYMNSDGIMATNIKKDGYTIDSSGVATKTVQTITSSSSNSSSSGTSSSSSSSSSKNSSSSNGVSSNKVTSDTVYVSSKGIYHTSANAHGMKNSTAMSREEAIANGYRACQSKSCS